MAADDELLERARSGDLEARERLLVESLAGLRAFVRARLGERLRAREESDDLAQSIAREVLEDLPRFQGGGVEGFRRWLFVRAEHKLADKGRFWAREKRDRGRETRIEGGAGGLDPVEARLLDLATPSRNASAREELTRVEAAFAKLPDDWRRAILLVKVAGLSHAEAGAELGRTEVAMRIVLSRALARLALLLEERE